MKRITVFTLALVLMAGMVAVEAGEIKLISPQTTLEEGEPYIFSIALPGDSENWLEWVQEEFEGYKNFQYLEAKKSGQNIYVLARAENQPSTAGYHGMKIASDFELIFWKSGLSNVGAKLPSLLDGVYKTNLEYIPYYSPPDPVNTKQVSSDVIPKNGKKYTLTFSSDTLHEPNYTGSDRYHTKRLIVDVLRNSNFLHLTTGIGSKDSGYMFYIAFTLRPGFSTAHTLYQLGQSLATLIESEMEAWGKNVTFAKAYELVPYRTD